MRAVAAGALGGPRQERRPTCSRLSSVEVVLCTAFFFLHGSAGWAACWAAWLLHARCSQHAVARASRAWSPLRPGLRIGYGLELPRRPVTAPRPARPASHRLAGLHGMQAARLTAEPCPCHRCGPRPPSFGGAPRSSAAEQDSCQCVIQLTPRACYCTGTALAPAAAPAATTAPWVRGPVCMTLTSRPTAAATRCAPRAAPAAQLVATPFSLPATGVTIGPACRVHLSDQSTLGDPSCPEALGAAAGRRAGMSCEAWAPAHLG